MKRERRKKKPIDKLSRLSTICWFNHWDAVCFVSCIWFQPDKWLSGLVQIMMCMANDELIVTKQSRKIYFESNFTEKLFSHLLCPQWNCTQFKCNESNSIQFWVNEKLQKYDNVLKHKKIKCFLRNLWWVGGPWAEAIQWEISHVQRPAWARVWNMPASLMLMKLKFLNGNNDFSTSPTNAHKQIDQMPLSTVIGSSVGSLCSWCVCGLARFTLAPIILSSIHMMIRWNQNATFSNIKANNIRMYSEKSFVWNIRFSNQAAILYVLYL